MIAFIVMYITGGFSFCMADDLPDRSREQYFITGEVYVSPCYTEPTTQQYIKHGDTIHVSYVGWCVIDSVKTYYP